MNNNTEDQNCHVDCNSQAKGGEIKWRLASSLVYEYYYKEKKILFQQSVTAQPDRKNPEATKWWDVIDPVLRERFTCR
jgi:serine protease inhibitor ecotin